MSSRTGQRPGGARTRVLSFVGLAGVVVLGGAALGGPAVAAAGPDAAPTDPAKHLELSHDGVTWGPSLVGPLYGPTTTIVPGHAARAALWIRNASADPAFASILTSSELGTGGGLGAWLTVEIDGEPVDAGVRWPGPLLDPGESVQVAVDVRLDEDAPAAVRAARTVVLEEVTLTQATEGDGGTPTVSPPGGDVPVPPSVPGTLPWTGWDGTALLWAGGLVMLGTVLLGAASRRDAQRRRQREAA